MKTTMAFVKKEFLEKIRTGKLVIIMILSVFFGILNPALSKLTPYLMEKLAGQDQGFQISIDVVDATMSWQQFCKNIPVLIIVILLMFAGTVVNEFQKGTIIPVITKGLSKQRVLMAKYFVLVSLWTVGYFLCYFITYFYTDYYWDNSVINDIGFMALCYWLFGIFIFSLLLLFSAIANETSGVLIGIGLVYFAMTILSISKSLKEYLPLKLSDGGFAMGNAVSSDYVNAVIITASASVVAVILSLLLVKDKKI